MKYRQVPDEASFEVVHQIWQLSATARRFQWQQLGIELLICFNFSS